MKTTMMKVNLNLEQLVAYLTRDFTQIKRLKEGGCGIAVKARAHDMSWRVLKTANRVYKTETLREAAMKTVRKFDSLKRRTLTSSSSTR